MRLSRKHRLGFVLLAMVALWTNHFALAEPADDFLVGLRMRGWHDTALEYLDSIGKDPLISDEFKSKIDYERAVTGTALARRATNQKARTAALINSAAAFIKFADSQPNSPYLLQALSTAGTIYSDLALADNNKAEKLPDNAAKQREQLQKSATKYLDKAKQPLTKLQQECMAKISQLPKAAEAQKNRAGQVSRQVIEGKLAEAKFLLAKLSFETARTRKKGSKGWKQALQSAQKAFEKLYDQYDDKLVGFFGRFYEGRCLQALGEPKQALKKYLTIVDQPPIPNRDFRRLTSRTYLQRAQCHLALKDIDAAIKECNEWLEEATSQERTESDWIAVSYVLATSYETKAESLKGNAAKQQLTEARKLYLAISKQSGEYQLEAKAKIAAGGGASEKAQLVETFAEAFAAGKQALGQLNSTKLAVKLAKENNPDSVESLESQFAAEKQVAADYFRQAINLTDDETERDELATALYFLCGIHWEQGHLDDAAVVAEFLARRYPDNKYAPAAAKLALAAYERMYSAAKKAGDSADYEADLLSEVAELLVTRWPKSPEAQAGLNLRINIALRDNRLADAQKLLERLPPESRAGAELRLGTSLWIKYLRATAKSNTPSETSRQLMRQAGEMLSSGFAGIKDAPQVTSNEASGVLYLAQFLLADGKANEAVAALENNNVGPLSLIKNQETAASSPTFQQSSYTSALRAYLSTDPPSREKAQSMMTSLEKTIGSGKDSEQKLIGIYFNLGLQLQQQIRTLNSDGKQAKARSVAAAFADLLARVTEKAGSSSSWKVQSWIAQTNLQLGEGLSGEDAAMYFKKAAEAYKTLIAKAEKNPKFAPSSRSLLAVKKKLADCQVAQGDYAEAMKQYALILKDKPSLLELQKSAALALQAWGTEKQDSQKLNEAIRGAMPQGNRKNLIWGWLRMSQVVENAKRGAQKKAAKDPKQAQKAAEYKDLFFEARLRASEARFSASKLASGGERTEQLNSLRQSLKTMKSLYPELGGAPWQADYLKLIEQVEQEQ